jgi:hypothetical protein
MIRPIAVTAFFLPKIPVKKLLFEAKAEIAVIGVMLSNPKKCLLRKWKSLEMRLSIFCMLFLVIYPGYKLVKLAVLNHFPERIVCTRYLSPQFRIGQKRKGYGTNTNN